MKYMLPIYSDENAWTEDEREHCYAESVQLTRSLHEQGRFLGASPLQPVSTATCVPGPGRDAARDRQSVRRDARTARRLLPDRREDLDEAIDIAGLIPSARVGTVEIRPVVELAGLPSNE